MIARVEGVEAPEHRRSFARPRHGQRMNPRAGLVLAVCGAAGIAAIVYASEIAQTRLTGTSEFAWFWAGMFLLGLPVAGLCARRATAPGARTALLVFYGLVSYAPKLLRDPTSPGYHDEFAHWRETYDILAAGRL